MFSCTCTFTDTKVKWTMICAFCEKGISTKVQLHTDRWGSTSTYVNPKNNKSVITAAKVQFAVSVNSPSEQPPSRVHPIGEDKVTVGLNRHASRNSEMKLVLNGQLDLLHREFLVEKYAEVAHTKDRHIKFLEENIDAIAAQKAEDMIFKKHQALMQAKEISSKRDARAKELEKKLKEVEAGKNALTDQLENKLNVERAWRRNCASCMDREAYDLLSLMVMSVLCNSSMSNNDVTIAVGI